MAVMIMKMSVQHVNLWPATCSMSENTFILGISNISLIIYLLSFYTHSVGVQVKWSEQSRPVEVLTAANRRHTSCHSWTMQSHRWSGFGFAEIAGSEAKAHAFKEWESQPLLATFEPHTALI